MFRHPFAALLLLGLLAPAAWSTPPMGRLVPVEGEPTAARLARVTADWQLELLPDGDDVPAVQRLSVHDLVSWGQPTPVPGAPRLLLYDGGQLAGTVESSDGDRVQVSSPLLGRVSVPLELLRGILFRPPRDTPRSDRLIVRLLAGNGRGASADAAAGADRVILENGDELTGTVLEIGQGKLRLDAAVGPLEIDLAGIVAVGFDPTLVVPPRRTPHRVVVGLRDGTRATASQLVLDDQSVQLTLAGLETLQTGPAPSPTAWLAPADSVVFLQPLSGGVVYLSDLEPAGYRHVPFVTLPWPYAADRSVAGTLLRAGGRLYVKGLGMHSTSRLTYRLDGGYQRFESLAAIDDHTQGRGSVTFRVFVDGQQRYASPIVRGGMPPQEIKVDLEGADELSLIVDFADFGDEMDRANWLDARLVKARGE